MSVRYDGLITPHTAEGALPAHRFATYGAAAGGAKTATAGAKILGVTTLVAAASGEIADVVRDGIARIEYGGALAAGDPVASDADGKAVAVGATSGTNYHIGGYAEVAGAAGDLGSIRVLPGRIQG